MRRIVSLSLAAAAALALAACAGAYVAGDAGPHHENLSGERAPPPPPAP
jgi:hypothetical protein